MAAASEKAVIVAAAVESAAAETERTIVAESNALVERFIDAAAAAGTGNRVTAG